MTTRTMSMLDEIPVVESEAVPKDSLYLIPPVSIVVHADETVAEAIRREVLKRPERFLVLKGIGPDDPQHDQLDPLDPQDPR